jgi:hypothetical protein
MLGTAFGLSIQDWRASPDSAIRPCVESYKAELFANMLGGLVHKASGSFRTGGVEELAIPPGKRLIPAPGKEFEKKQRLLVVERTAGL